MWKETICYRICGAEANAERLLAAESVCGRRETRAARRSSGGAAPGKGQSAAGPADCGAFLRHFPLESPKSTAWMLLSRGSFLRWTPASTEKGQRGLGEAVGHGRAVPDPAPARSGALAVPASVRNPRLPLAATAWAEEDRGTSAALRLLVFRLVQT